MCGIAGIYNWDKELSQCEIVAAMTARLARRGPDCEGVYSEPGLAIGHKRLSIIDLSEHGRQPMSNEDGTVWLTFNGEIYNYRELRQRLERRGHCFRSVTDCEVLIHLYEESGEDLAGFLEPVRGMFAFGIWDTRRHRLLLARDRLGIKPLVYYSNSHSISFASDLDALTASPEVPCRLDWTSLYEYLLLKTVPGPHTIFRDIRCLMPGTMLLAERGSVREITYWRLDPIHNQVIVDPAEADEEIKAVLSDSIQLHLVADVEVGTFLSGGIDSGIITAMASEQYDYQLRTYSATFPGEQVNEGPWAREASERLGTTHSEFAVTGGFLDGIERVVEAMDQPLALTSAVSLFHLSGLAHRTIKVVLSGDGGDELFGGYTRYCPFPPPGPIARWIPREMRPTVGKFAFSMIPVSTCRRWSLLERIRTRAEMLSRQEVDLHTRTRIYMQPAKALSLLPDDVASKVDRTRYFDRLRRLFASIKNRDELTRRLYVDLQTSLVDEMLTKLDRMTMAWGLEARVPLLDHKLVELGMRLAGSIKRDERVGKLPLRRLAARYLGSAASERTKHGFDSPLKGWLQTDTRTRAKLESLWPAVEKAGTFDKIALRVLKGQIGIYGGSLPLNVFSLLVFGIWANQRNIQLE